MTLQWASSQGKGSPRGHVAKAMTCPHACSKGHDSPHREAILAKAHSQD